MPKRTVAAPPKKHAHQHLQHKAKALAPHNYKEKLVKLDGQVTNQIEKRLKKLSLDEASCRKIMALLLERMEEGLDPNRVEKASVKMLPSYVRSVPNGTECGHFLALDLGGTNFRVLLIELKGKNECEMQSKIFRVPHAIMIGTGEALFDHIAACMAQFMEEEGLKGKKLPLGFTFSFPCEQDGLTKARLLTWTKGFKCDGVEGEDVVKLLQQAVHRRNDVEIDVVALLNDTTGTLMSCAYFENSCNIGVIVGTGSNACYMEKISRVPKIHVEPRDPEEICINTEWGAFGNDSCLDFMRTPYDFDIDKHSINPGKQLFEKMISGMYLGELTRLVLEDLTKAGLLFHGEGSDDLYTRGKFPTKYVSEIEAEAMDEEKTFTVTHGILEDLGIINVQHQDCLHVALACAAVSSRAADLCAAGIATILNRMQKPFVTVGVDGSVYRFHPTFKDLLEKRIAELIDPDLNFQLMLSEDGSGRGAALVAAVACRLEEERAKKVLQNGK